MTIVTYFPKKVTEAEFQTIGPLYLHWVLCPGQEKKKEGGSKGGTDCTGRYKGVQAVRPESVAGGGLPVHPLGLFMDKDYCRPFQQLCGQVKSVRFNVHIQSKLLQYMPVMGTHSIYQLRCLSSTVGQYLIITFLEVSEKDDVAFKTPILVGVSTEMRTQHLPATVLLRSAPRLEGSLYSMGTLNIVIGILEYYRQNRQRLALLYILATGKGLYNTKNIRQVTGT